MTENLDKKNFQPAKKSKIFAECQVCITNSAIWELICQNDKIVISKKLFVLIAQIGLFIEILVKKNIFLFKLMINFDSFKFYDLILNFWKISTIGQFHWMRFIFRFWKVYLILFYDFHKILFYGYLVSIKTFCSHDIRRKNSFILIKKIVKICLKFQQ